MFTISFSSTREHDEESDQREQAKRDTSESDQIRDVTFSIEQGRGQQKEYANEQHRERISELESAAHLRSLQEI